MPPVIYKLDWRFKMSVSICKYWHITKVDL